MLKTSRLVWSLAVATLAVGGCGAAPGEDATSGEDAVTATASPIKHVVLIVQENHSFDAYFGNYCNADTNSNPTCHDGPDCCETSPEMIWTTHGIPWWPQILNDATNVDIDRNHDSGCEVIEMNCPEGNDLTPGAAHGECKMDGYVNVASFFRIKKLGPLCGGYKNFAVAGRETMATYHGYAQEGAIGDAYFQPVIGQTSSNDMFFARAQFEFLDNELFPDRAGTACQTSALPTKPKTGLYKDKTTIADLLVQNDAKRGFGYYHLGYDLMRKGAKDKHDCPTVVPAGCPDRLRVGPLSVACQYDPSDDPFKYYEQFGDDSPYIHDYDQLAMDVAAKRLPSVVYVKATTAMNEHPGFGAISTGQAFVKKTVDTVLGSSYRDDTLVLITWDEGGGFYDHKSPPIASDGRRMGTRVPIIALGKYARKSANGYVSHVQMEHSSIVKFLEWNFLGKVTGQLGGRESSVHNIGSLIDPALDVPDGREP